MSSKTQKNQKKTDTKEKAKPKQAPVQRAPRRGGYKKGGPRTVQGRNIKRIEASNNVRLNYAQGSRSNVMVEATVVPAAVESMPCSIISNVLTFGGVNTTLSPIFWVYFAILSDLISIFTNKVSPVSSRLKYLNAILATYLPKTILFKTGTLSYGWLGTNTISINDMITTRGYNFYMFVDGGLVLNGWPLQVAPVNPANVDVTLEALASAYTLLGNLAVPHLGYTTNINFSDEYKRDASGFAAVSPYYGRGNSTSSGSSYSGELEVPFRSIVLSGVSQYSTTAGRVARNFCIGSGDSTCAAGLAFIPGMDMPIYNTKYPIQYNYLDLDEICVWLQSWYITLVSQTIKNANGEFTDVSYALIPFTQSAQTFRIVIRQAVLAFFSASQNMAQFMTYSSDSSGFEPFRCGSNCYAPNRCEIYIPELLVENLRMLLPKFFKIPTNFQNDKNQLVCIPVWGIYKSEADTPINLAGTFLNPDGGTATYNIFTGDSSLDPSPIDGSFVSGEVADLNSTIVSSFILEWNARIQLLKGSSLPVTYLGGNSKGCMLNVTRFANYSNIDVPMSEISPFVKHLLPKNYITKKKLERSDSKKIAKEEKEYYIPTGASLFSQRTTAYSSLTSITETLKLLFNYFIFPTIVVEPQQVPTQRQARVAILQCHILDVDPSVITVASRGTKLVELGILCAPGVAASNTDELSNVIKAFAEDDKGGFIGDILAMLATSLPI